MTASIQYFDFYKYAFWRYVFVQEVVEKFAKSFIEFPQMQKPASFNLDAIKGQVEVAMKAHAMGA
jgi:hypothetical protein